MSKIDQIRHVIINKERKIDIQMERHRQIDIQMERHKQIDRYKDGKT